MKNAVYRRQGIVGSGWGRRRGCTCYFVCVGGLGGFIWGVGGGGTCSNSLSQVFLFLSFFPWEKGKGKGKGKGLFVAGFPYTFLGTFGAPFILFFFLTLLCFPSVSLPFSLGVCFLFFVFLIFPLPLPPPDLFLYIIFKVFCFLFFVFTPASCSSK